MLTFGSWNTICTKLQAQKDARKRGDNHCVASEGQAQFNKPWLVNMYMFIGESSLLIIYGIQKRQRREARALASAANPSAERPPMFYVFAIPAFCDVFGTGLAAMGQTRIDSSVWQMLR